MTKLMQFIVTRRRAQLSEEGMTSVFLITVTAVRATALTFLTHIRGIVVTATEKRHGLLCVGIPLGATSKSQSMKCSGCIIDC